MTSVISVPVTVHSTVCGTIVGILIKSRTVFDLKFYVPDRVHSAICMKTVRNLIKSRTVLNLKFLRSGHG